ncbi:hypothetical protein CRP603_gp05 [Roseobacter phage CRP-603]|nr:hypothetical protein CRP603_gp05 [Roseobacter phage CRP-603]
MTKLTKREQLLILIADLGWDYDKMSSSGQKTYDDICKLLGIE